MFGHGSVELTDGSIDCVVSVLLVTSPGTGAWKHFVLLRLVSLC